MTWQEPAHRSQLCHEVSDGSAPRQIAANNHLVGAGVPVESGSNARVRPHGDPVRDGDTSQAHARAWHRRARPASGNGWRVTVLSSESRSRSRPRLNASPRRSSDVVGFTSLAERYAYCQPHLAIMNSVAL